MRHLISIADLTDRQVRQIVERGAEFADGERSRALDEAVVGVYFRKTSTRTRTAFSSGALRLGARIIAYGPEDLQTNTGETLKDTGQVFSRMLDGLVARTAAPTAELRAWTGQERMGVVNAMTTEEHPTQALTDLTTLFRHFGRIDGLRVLYLGEGNNTAAALALALPRFPGTVLDLRTPPGYGVPGKGLTAPGVTQRHDLKNLESDYDVIYTTRWQTTGTSKPDPDWRQVFAPFQVGEQLWRDSPKAVFMHDLPAHRGEEVTAAVLDGRHSIAFDQAGNKLYSAMAVLEWCLAGSR
ncbi:ornithine carbamoyltransferase [Kineosporia sp. NBRC 101677]|uniref:ornithine carbamoyltransferase n=1 Tax=Kineosporia sp. NBRC 101677 TaxID=3032197 RepID=UPI0024A1ED8A|nr:hypothetical protein [Kineosporia sp. NBRC 101677]GLY18826.1 ornithine carbamoyltransferase [Kineosporia sp. NBRC 101677]